MQSVVTEGFDKGHGANGLVKSGSQTVDPGYGLGHMLQLRKQLLLTMKLHECCMALVLS